MQGVRTVIFRGHDDGSKRSHNDLVREKGRRLQHNMQRIQTAVCVHEVLVTPSQGVCGVAQRCDFSYSL
jgi:hypothetical protein